MPQQSLGIDANKIWQVTIKGLVFDTDSKLLLLQEEDGMWELPGGRIEHGEEILETLRREIKEEMGVACNVVDPRPYWVYPEHLRSLAIWRIVLGYRTELASHDFITSDECVGSAYFDHQGLLKLGNKLWPLGVIPLLKSEEARK